MTEFSVLVIDDEQDFVSSLVRRLCKRGLKSEGALTGGEAIRKIADGDFAVALLDMRLPDMYGSDVLREIVKIKPQTRVIILTGHASAREGEEGIRDGAFDYLIKPVEFETLWEKLQAAKMRSP